jgi:hypothetical protein
MSEVYGVWFIVGAIIGVVAVIGVLYLLDVAKHGWKNNR